MNEWTSAKPNLPGWYWYQDDSTPKATIVLVLADMKIRFVNGAKCEASRMIGRWCGPLSPPADNSVSLTCNSETGDMAAIDA